MLSERIPLLEPGYNIVQTDTGDYLLVYIDCPNYKVDKLKYFEWYLDLRNDYLVGFSLKYNYPPQCIYLFMIEDAEVISFSSVDFREFLTRAYEVTDPDGVYRYTDIVYQLIKEKE